MEFERSEAPYVRPRSNVGSIMRQVLYALVPAAIAYVWFFGFGFIFNLLIAALFCAAGEALMMHARGKPPEWALSDFTALVTAALIAFCLPALTPWWVTATASLFAIVVAKHLYGGMGFNIFNPAMAGYVVALVAFPMYLNFWPAPRIGDLDYHHLTFYETARYTLTGSLPDYLSFDAISRATPLDTVKTGLANMRTFDEIHSYPLMGDFGGRGWEWIANWYAIGGSYLLWRRVIRWQVPVALLGATIVLTLPAWLADPAINPFPMQHVFSGALVMAAFFIATDPVTGCTTPRGQLFFGAGVAIITLAIRRWGAYPDGVAFAILLMNCAAPWIDLHTRPRIFGEARRRPGRSDRKNDA